MSNPSIQHRLLQYERQTGGREAKKTDKRGYNLSTDFNTTLLVLENLSVGAEKKNHTHALPPVNIIPQIPSSLANTSGSKTPCPREDSLLLSRQQGRVTRGNKGESPGTTRTSHRGEQTWLAWAVTRASTCRTQAANTQHLTCNSRKSPPNICASLHIFQETSPGDMRPCKNFLTPQTQHHIQQSRALATRTHTSGAGTFRPLMCYIKEDFRPIYSVSPP